MVEGIHIGERREVVKWKHCVFSLEWGFFKVEGVAEVGAHSHWVPLREGRRRLPGFYSSAGPG